MRAAFILHMESVARVVEWVRRYEVGAISARGERCAYVGEGRLARVQKRSGE